MSNVMEDRLEMGQHVVFVWRDGVCWVRNVKSVLG